MNYCPQYISQYSSYTDLNFILDNASIHKRKKILEYLKVCRMLYLPSYSPQLNPIEKLLKSLKDYVSQTGELSEIALFKRIHQFLI